MITEHTHLEGGNEREILPWLRLSAELDPQRVETYTVAAYWLRAVGKMVEAEHFLREGLRVTLIGLACGLAGALVIAQFMASILFKVTPTDTLTYGTVIFVTFATALPAVWIPARRAVKVDPIENLRQA